MRCIDALKSGDQRNRSAQQNEGAGQTASAKKLAAVLDKLKKLQEKYAEQQEQFGAEFGAESDALVSQVNLYSYCFICSRFHFVEPLCCKAGISLASAGRRQWGKCW